MPRLMRKMESLSGSPQPDRFSSLEGLGVKAYWEDRLGRSFGPEGVGFRMLGRNYNHAMYQVRRAVFKRILKETGRSFAGARVLDIGCGTGFYVDQWERAGAGEITGVDITAVSVEKLGARFPNHSFFQADIGSDISMLPRQDFDAISAFDVLFHIVDDEGYAQALKNIRSLLAPRGLLLWSDNFLHGAELRTSIQASRTLGHIEDILARSGFEIRMRRPMFLLMNAPVDAPGRLHRAAWRLLERTVPRSEALGWLAGKLLAPLEILLLRRATEGPSTEWMICEAV
ncbi:MAG: class I SAM-dependent methyltransferase [Thermodesulfobacteriota bacterium]